jgi:hypothetical protein
MVVLFCAVALNAAFAAPIGTTLKGNSGLSAYLSTYVSNSVIYNSTFFNQQVSGQGYVVMQVSNISNNYLVILNQSPAYKIVTNTTTINNVLTPLLTGKFTLNQSTVTFLNLTMHEYQSFSAQNLTACEQETGINVNTCTYANACFACQTVPVCKRVLSNFGVNSPFGFGVINFSVNTNKLNTNYTNYYRTLSSINSQNAGTVAAQLSTIVSNITSISLTFNNNPVFPPPAGTSYNSCYNGGSLNNVPWYCNAVAFCNSVPFNSSSLGAVRGRLSTIEQNLPTASTISAISTNSSTEAQTFISTALQNTNGASFSSLMKTYYPQYNTIVNGSTALLARYNNISLNSSLKILTIQFNAIQNEGVNQSINVSSNILASLIANTTKLYQSANASYSQARGIAQNNSAAILADELSYHQVPSSLASLANRQQNINIQLNSRINSNTLASIVPSLQSIRVQSTVFVAPFTVGYMIKTIDEPFISAILSSSNAYAPSSISSAPLFAAIMSLIIGIVILIIVYIIFYFRIQRKGKLKGNKRSQRTWIAVFAGLVVVILAYTFITYAYAGSANTFLPFNYFMNTVRASPTTYVALNGSATVSNASIGSCVSALQGYLSKAGKSVQVIRLSNYSCISGSNISVLGINCYSGILNSGKPVIFVTQSQQSGLVYRGLYGTVLYASGNVTSGRSCTLASLFKGV